jgi:hypothetical protein
MNEGTGMADGAGASEAAGLDAQGAAVIMQGARERARHELTINRPVIFVSWAMVYLLGYGVVWLSVRGQRPFHAPEGWALALLALLALLAVLALGVTAQVTDRAASGVGGVSQLRRRIYWLSLAVGLLGVYVMQPALRYAGAGRGVISVFTASSPLLVAGVVLAAGTAAWLNWYAFGLGVWLIAVAAFSGFAGPAGVWAVDALAVGVPFLVMAAITLARGRS